MVGVFIQPNGIYTLTDVAKRLRVSRRTLERAVAAGELAARRAGRHSYVTGRALLHYLERREGGGKAGDASKPDSRA